MTTSISRTFIATASAAALLAIATGAVALTPETMIPDFETAASTQANVKDILPPGTKVAVARVELGRFTPMPFSEQGRWEEMHLRTNKNFAALSPAAYVNALPEIDFGSQDTDNKLDEMRLASIDEGYDYLLVYGMGEDAFAGSFARRPVSRTGFDISNTPEVMDGGEAKAILVETRTGYVLGSVTAPVKDRYVSELSDAVAEMVNSL